MSRKPTATGSKSPSAFLQRGSERVVDGTGRFAVDHGHDLVSHALAGQHELTVFDPPDELLEERTRRSCRLSPCLPALLSARRRRPSLRRPPSGCR